MQVHETIQGRNAQRLNGDDHHLVCQSDSKTCVYGLGKTNGSEQNIHKRLNV